MLAEWSDRPSQRGAAFGDFSSLVRPSGEVVGRQRGDHPGFRFEGYVTVVVAGGACSMALDSIQDTGVDPDLPRDSLEPMPPTVVWSDATVCDVQTSNPCGDLIRNDARWRILSGPVELPKEQRPGSARPHKAQEAELDKVRVKRNVLKGARFDCSGVRREPQEMDAVLLSHVLLAELCELAILAPLYAARNGVQRFAAAVLVCSRSDAV
jgi:hypothetical protein